MNGVGGLLSGFRCADYDISSDPSYFGFVNESGKFYIMKMDSTGVATSFQFSKDGASYAVAWGARTTLNYDYLYNTF